MTLQPGKQTNTVHILPNILRSKGNETMKLGQWIEYNMKNIFLKSFTQFIFIVWQIKGYLKILN